MVNGRAASADVDPQMIGGRMMVPIRFVAEELGANVTWDPKTRTVRLLQGNEDVTMTIGSTRSTVNGEGRALAVAPVIRRGRTLLPLRDVARFTGSMADYNPDTRTVFVTTPGGRGGNAASGTGAGVGGS
jgi:N-acetylmuramoyl-L-alanine amidase